MGHRTTWMTLAMAALGAAGALTALPAGASGSVFIEMQQPPQRYQPVVPAPPSQAWVPGHWQWAGNRQVWVEGHYWPVGPGYQGSHGYARGYPPGYAHGDNGRRTGPDHDRDGVPDRYDRDRDGDGVPNRYDRQPNNTWRR